MRKERRGRWTVNRALYDWWFQRIGQEIRVGHRFYGIMTLAIYAKKCGIDEDELRRDAFSLLDGYDSMSEEQINRFSDDDIICALEMYNEDYVTFPRDDIARLSGLQIKPNKRNGRKQAQHLKLARGQLSILKDMGELKSSGGRPTAAAVVREYQQQHPTATKAEVIRGTGLSKPTVYKYYANQCSREGGSE